MQNLTEYRGQKWVILVSGGPDSMALLDVVRRASVRPFVLHVNYHARESALRDQQIVSDYCQQHEIDLQIIDARFPGGSNFQAWARDVRYRAAADRVKQTDSLGIMAAHHRDDVLETYMMQVRANKHVGWYGIRDNSTIFDTKVIRPLLKWSKQELIDYCESMNVDYGIDESNLSIKYVRNRIRKEAVLLSEEEKAAMIQEMNEKNHRIEADLRNVESLINQDSLDARFLDGNRILLRAWLSKHATRKTFATKFLDEILRQVSDKRNFEIQLDKNETLLFQYDRLRIVSKVEEICIVLDTVEYKDYDKFSLREKGEIREGLCLLEGDFPLTFRSLKPGDAIRLSFGTKSINRWCIDRKIPFENRRRILVVENACQEIIFASSIGANVTHTCAHPRVFVVK